MRERPDKVVVALGDALATECQAIFGATWSNDIRQRLARAALKSLEEQGAREYDIRGLISGDLSTCDGYCNAD